MRIPGVLLLLGSFLREGFTSFTGSADLSKAGPCAVKSWRLSMPVPSELQRMGLPSTLPVNATVPTCPAGTGSPFGAAPFPVLFFFNGFMNRASWYWRLVQRTASWGVLVIQYDTPFTRILPVGVELQLFPELVQWLADQTDTSGSPLFGQADMGRVSTAGHSRGGKLASLAFTGSPGLVRASFLVDPVDTTRYAPESPANPSAVRALASSGLPVGIAGAGIVGSCNPAEGNYKRFWEAAGNGSWQGVVTGAGHGQFMDAGCLGNFAADRLCGRGASGRVATAELTATPMLAWLWEQMEGQEAATGGSAVPSPLPTFYSWVAQQKAAGRLQWEVKGGEEAAAWEAGTKDAPPAPAAAPTAAAEAEEACAPLGQ